MRSKASPFRALLSLFVAVVFAIAATPGSMAMPAPKAADHVMAGMDCSKAAADCGHMKAPQDQSKPCKNMAACLGMLNCFGMGAVEFVQISPLPAIAEAAVPITRQIETGLTLTPDNPPPIALMVVPAPARFAPACTPSFHSKRSCWAEPSQEKNMNTLKYAAAAAIIAIVALTPSALAGSNGMHRMPADYGKVQPVYALQTNGVPEAGKPLVVTLVDSNGQAVPGGEVAVLRPAHHPLKASPAPSWIAVPLPRDATGHFVCAGAHYVPGSHIVLQGNGPNGTSPVTLDLTVKS